MRKIKNASWAAKISISALIIIVGFSAFKADYFEISKQLELFTGVFKEVNMYYVDETEPSQLMEKAVKGMLKSLDPYTVYIPESDIEDYRMMQTGQYGGIGSTIRMIDGKVIIADPHEGFPADKAGLKAGDWIKQVDGNIMTGKNTDQVSEVLKGTPGSEVELVYEREGKEYTIKLKREEIQLKSVPYYGMLDENTGYIYLNSFTDKASRDVKTAFLELKQNPNMNQVILDLRGNGGGLLGEAVNIANIFVDKGTEVVSMRGKLKESNKVYKTLRAAEDTEIPLAILINEGSASASEIVAGTIQDLDRGIIVGQKSYGKGLVQQIHKVQYGAQVKITIAKYYTPSGRCIQAINYAERAEDGSVARIPDSLRTEFKTKNNRSVFDGGGISPDIAVSDENASDILISLVQAGHIFTYAIEYYRNHDSIPGNGKFALSDEEYEDFVDYLKDKHYEYKTNTERRIEQLKLVAENEEYNGLQDEIARLEQKAKELKGDDLHRYKHQIATYLEQEIAARYFYQAGELRQSLNGDPIVEQAINALKDRKKYNELLAIAN